MWGIYWLGFLIKRTDSPRILSFSTYPGNYPRLKSAQAMLQESLNLQDRNSASVPDKPPEVNPKLLGYGPKTPDKVIQSYGQWEKVVRGELWQMLRNLEQPLRTWRF